MEALARPELYPWEEPDAPEHVKARQPVMEIALPSGIRRDLPRRRPADELPRSLQGADFGIVVMTHRGYSNGRLSVCLSSIPENYPVTVSSDAVTPEEVAGDREVAEYHGAAFSHATPWGGRAANARHCMDCTTWRVTLFICDDVWLFPEAVSNAVRWFHIMEAQDIPLACLGVPGWETYREHIQWGFRDWKQCLEEPWRFEAVPPHPNFVKTPALYKNPFGACMVLNRDAYRDLDGFARDYWAHDDMYNHKVWLSGRWVNAVFPGRGYMHLGAQSWHHGESEAYVGTFDAAAGMTAEESGQKQVKAIERWAKILASRFLTLGGTPSV